MKRFLAASSILALSAAPALADGEWTGGYAGGQIGYADIGLSGGLQGGSNGSVGLHGGYAYDFGGWVLGGEAEYDWTDVGIAGDAVTVENVFRLKAKLGYDLGGVLAYAVAGAAWAYTDNLGDDNGWLAGAGVAYKVTPQWVLSGELLYHEFSDFNSTGIDVDATTLNFRASFQF